uniref:chitinase n=1 Tax=Chilo infuscatellus TaxID=236790 RepID=A0A5J6DR43_9NEOP|nr:chitinase domain-containing protein 11 [Chilo infuscatellus]
MKGLILLSLLFTLGAVHTTKIVGCYYGTWAAHRPGLGRFTVNDIDPHLCTHLVYAFAGLGAQGNVKSLDPELDLADDGGADNYRLFNEIKQKNTGLKTLLAIGGWNELSAKFSNMAASPTLRKKFIESAIVTLTKHGFDGVVISWLYPNERDTPNHQADIENFAALLKEMKVYFDERGLLVTIAVTAAGEAATKSYVVASIAQYVHFIHLMTHDFHGPWDAVTGHNSALHKEQGTLFAVDAAVKYWLEKGCPPGKLVLGIPFYGHTYRLRYASIHGINSPSTGPGIMGPYTRLQGAIGYNELCNITRTERWTVQRDAVAQVPYAYSGDNWASYDDAASVRAKVQLARTYGLIGVYVWSVETDDFNNVCGGGRFPLLHAVNNALNEESTIDDDSIDSTQFTINNNKRKWRFTNK